jgi:hypothetical protein
MKKKLIICLTTLFFVGNIVSDIHPVYSETNQSVTVQGHVYFTEYGWFDLENVLVTLIAGSDTLKTYTDSNGWYEIELPLVSPYVDETVNPKAFTLYQNYPNPFNPSTVIEYDVARPAHVTLNIYNITGQKVRRLRDGYENIGTQRVQWDGRDNSGRSVGAGIYLYCLRAGNVVQTKKMILLDGGGSYQQKSALLSKTNSSRGAGKKAGEVFTIIVMKDGFEPYRGRAVASWSDYEYDTDFVVSPSDTLVTQNFFLQRYHPSVETYSYSLIAYKPVFRTYAEGGGLSILRMTPKENFSGEVNLSVIAEPNLHLEITKSTISLSDSISEITIRPDSTVTQGLSNIKIISIYNATPDTMNIFAFVSTGSPPGTTSQTLRDEFIQWLNANHQELEITTGLDWFGYDKSPGTVGGRTYTYLNQTWEITLSWELPPPPCLFLLRKRGIFELILAAEKNDDGIIYEIPIENWFYNL